MSEKNLPKKYKKIYRLIGVLGFILLLASCLHKIIISFIYGYSEENSKQELVIIILLNSICSVLFFLIILKPEKLEFFAIISFVYMLNILITDCNNLIPVCMLELCIIALYSRGFFVKKKQLKISLLCLFYLIALFSEIRFGFNKFITSFLLNIGALFIISVSAIIFQRQITSVKISSIPQILDLTSYDQLTDQDKKIIRLIKEGNKYEWIAGHLGMATSTLKKRVKNIFEILDVVDLIDFHAQLGKLTFIYTKEELLEWKKKFLEDNFGKEED